MKLKICGMKNPENIQAVAELKPNFMGFIFYEKSPRNVTGELDKNVLKALPESIKKIGVFVNANSEFITKQVAEYQLDGVQLHGNESPELCSQLKAHNVLVFKAFSVDDNFDFTVTEPYKRFVDYFLFDTKATGGHGGHGVAFDWKVLNGYDNEVPFLLAGGVSLENVEEVKKLTYLNIFGIDVNSKFEIEPGLKDVEKLRELKSQLRH